MRVIIGGAHNGKRKYVKGKLEKDSSKNLHFYEGVLPEKRSFSKNDKIIIGNFEDIFLSLNQLEEERLVSNIVDTLKKIDQNAEVICICTDIGRGIVPLQKEDRKLRDACGRLYQKLFLESDCVIRIWYGIPEVLKGEEW
ncbi:adenosylcobinamide kinase [Lysinibacillus yapensis]|uniref:Adenosylcobinamide kinase n=1 Tax=Ureibacillus yapensis TaxID=2304605 RepID=A0A396SB03_9BACL|nr:bifunctional adenosylcobinamide kinase/adenosylcobinamide-phosphate guanylyltransferase [Lysinibacillus yapensis]RHW38541.1 adenosylcobinamide kinase [Lysinibacillus yapensis]